MVYNPVMRELFTAVAGRGARLNGTPIRVSDNAELSSALLVTEVGVARDDATVGAIFGRIGALTKQVLQSHTPCPGAPVPNVQALLRIGIWRKAGLL